jgi:HAE1 family hydrophobic/amphiphilic exporter-1
MGFLALVVICSIAWMRIPLQMMPSGFEPGFLYVWVPYPDSSPQEIDEQLVRPIEEELGTVTGLHTIVSHAGQEDASFELHFHGSVDMGEAYSAVVDRMERAMPLLPEDALDYGVFKFDMDDAPILWAGVSLSESIADPHHVMSRIVQPRLERIPGVARVNTWGVPQRVVQIDYERDKLYSHGVDLGSLQRRMRQDNLQMSGGRITDQGAHRHVRSIARIDDVNTLINYPVKDNLVLKDIATIRVGGLLSSDFNRINGQEAASIAVKKESSANTVAVTDALLEALDELQADPRLEGSTFFAFFNQGELITDSIDTLVNTALLGAVFAVFILYSFLREWRMTLLIALSIPFSILITIAALYVGGDSLNLLALMGLMLAVGLVVDNAIVVVETIYRKRAEGLEAVEAAVEGTAEVNLAIITSTLTTVVVFIPLMLMGDGGFNFFLGALGRPVIFAVLGSLVVALIFAPLVTKYMRQTEVRPDPAWLTWLSNRYQRLLGWILRHRVDTTMVLLGLILLTVAVAVPGVQCSDSAKGNLNEFKIRFSVPPQASIDERDEILQVFESLVEEHREEWGVRVFRSRLSGESNHGRLTVYLEDDGPMKRDEAMKAARKELPKNIPGVEGTIGWEGGRSGSGNQFKIHITGEDLDILRALASEVIRRVEGIEEVLGAQVPEFDKRGPSEFRLRINREAVMRYGLTAREVGGTVAYAMRGSRLEPIRDGERELEVRSRISLADRGSLESLLDFGIWAPSVSRLVPVRAVTDVETGTTPDGIHRTKRKTGLMITVDLEEEANLEEVVPVIDASLEDMRFPYGYQWEKGDRYWENMEEMEAQQYALLLSVVFVFLIMGVLFESLAVPLAIITTVPMALMGAFWLLYLTGTDFDTMAGIGLVVLVGIIVNNGIVLVDLVTQLRRQGLSIEEALVRAGERRMRPILMTAMTTISGLLPMAMGATGFVGISYAPLGRTVIGGLAAGTILTLLFVPFLYALIDDVRGGLSTWLRVIWGER